MNTQVSFDDLGVHIILDILRYLDVKTIGKVLCTSKLHAILAFEVFSKSSAILTAVYNGCSGQILKLLQRLQAPPTLVIITDTTNGPWRNHNIARSLLPFLPRNATTIYSQCSSVQAACLSGDDDVYYFDDTDVNEKSSPFSVMLGSFPNAISTAFILGDEVLDTVKTGSALLSKEILLSAGMHDPDQDWKVFIIYSSGFDSCDSIVASLQKTYPRAAIIGGLTGGIVSVSHGTNMSSKRSKAMACVALRGEVPVRVVVSRGVEPVSEEYRVNPEDIQLVRSARGHGQTLQISRFIYGSDLEPETGTGNPPNNEQSEAPLDLLRQVTSRIQNMRPHPLLLFLGLRSSTTEPYFLAHTQSPEKGCVMAHVEDVMACPVPVSVRFFALTSAACRRDVRESLLMAKERLLSNGDVPMATLLFSCAARGPTPNYAFDEDQMDARTYTSVFPSVPLLGSYMGGEIGPHAAVGSTAETVIRTGAATQQGFTAVFGIFVVPRIASTLELLHSIESRGTSLDATFRSVLASFRRPD